MPKIRKQWNHQEVRLVTDRTVANIRSKFASENLSELTTKAVVDLIDIAQRQVLPEDRWRSFKCQNTLISNTYVNEHPYDNAQFAIFRELKAEGWRQTGSRLNRYKSDAEVEDSRRREAQRITFVSPEPTVRGPASVSDIVPGARKVPGDPLNGSTHPATDEVVVRAMQQARDEMFKEERNAPVVAGIANFFESVLKRLDALEARHSVAAKDAETQAEVAALRDEVKRLGDDLKNASDMDDLLTEELDTVREVVVQCTRGIKAELPTTKRATLVERQGKGPVVTIVGLRKRDEALINTKLRDLPNTSKLDVRYIQADCSAYQFKTRYALVMRWVGHSWYEQAKNAVADTADCRYLSHGSATKVVEELQKIADFENQKHTR